MNSINKVSFFIVIIIILSHAVPVGSSGIVFEWRPFIVNDFLASDVVLKDVSPKDIMARKDLWIQFEDLELLSGLDWRMLDNSSPKEEKKSSLSRIKITVTQANTFMLPENEIYFRDKNEKFVQASRIIPSLFRNPSKETTMETLKLIEPQINLGFEF